MSVKNNKKNDNVINEEILDVNVEKVITDDGQEVEIIEIEDDENDVIIDVNEDRIEELEEYIEELKKENDELKKENENLLRHVANVENEKKLIIKEAERKVSLANEMILKDLIKVIDAINSALKIEVDEDCKDCVSSYIDGIKMVNEMFHDVLNDYGIEKIKVEKFDPNYHQAIQKISDEKYEDDEIVDVLQDGYKIKDKVIRPSMVIVNKKS
jgi:molecular chaperone GrpE